MFKFLFSILVLFSLIFIGYSPVIDDDPERFAQNTQITIPEIGLDVNIDDSRGERLEPGQSILPADEGDERINPCDLNPASVECEASLPPVYEKGFLKSTGDFIASSLESWTRGLTKGPSPNVIDSCTAIREPGDYQMNSDIELSSPDSGFLYCIAIYADNVNLNCQGNSIRYTGTDIRRAISIYGSNNVVVENCLIEDFSEGISIEDSSLGPSTSIAISEVNINSPERFGIIITDGSSDIQVLETSVENFRDSILESERYALIVEGVSDSIFSNFNFEDSHVLVGSPWLGGSGGSTSRNVFTSFTSSSSHDFKSNLYIYARNGMSITSNEFNNFKLNGDLVLRISPGSNSINSNKFTSFDINGGFFSNSFRDTSGAPNIHNKFSDQEYRQFNINRGYFMVSDHEDSLFSGFIITNTPSQALFSIDVFRSSNNRFHAFDISRSEGPLLVAINSMSSNGNYFETFDVSGDFTDGISDSSSQNNNYLDIDLRGINRANVKKYVEEIETTGNLHAGNFYVDSSKVSFSESTSLNMEFLGDIIGNYWDDLQCLASEQVFGDMYRCTNPSSLSIGSLTDNAPLVESLIQSQSFTYNLEGSDCEIAEGEYKCVSEVSWSTNDPGSTLSIRNFDPEAIAGGGFNGVVDDWTPGGWTPPGDSSSEVSMITNYGTEFRISDSSGNIIERVTITGFCEPGTVIEENPSTGRRTCIASSSSETEITSCDTTITRPGNYILNQNLVTSTGTCIEILSNDVTLDCKGYSIEKTSGPIFSPGPYFVGVSAGRRDNINEYNNIRINNCVFERLNSAVIFNGVSDSLISNSEIIQSRIGLDLTNSENNIFNSLDIKSTTSREIQINDESSCNNQFTNLRGTESSKSILVFTPNHESEYIPNQELNSVILCNYDSKTLENLNIYSGPTSGEGLRLIYTDGTTIRDSDFNSRRETVVLVESNNNRFESNTFEGDSTTVDILDVKSGKNNVFTLNTFSDSNKISVLDSSTIFQENGLGNRYENFACSISESRGNYNICTNPATLSIDGISATDIIVDETTFAAIFDPFYIQRPEGEIVGETQITIIAKDNNYPFSSCVVHITNENGEVDIEPGDISGSGSQNYLCTYTYQGEGGEEISYKFQVSPVGGESIFMEEVRVNFISNTQLSTEFNPSYISAPQGEQSSLSIIITAGDEEVELSSCELEINGVIAGSTQISTDNKICIGSYTGEYSDEINYRLILTSIDSKRVELELKDIILPESQEISPEFEPSYIAPVPEGLQDDLSLTILARDDDIILSSCELEVNGVSQPVNLPDNTLCRATYMGSYSESINYRLALTSVDGERKFLDLKAVQFPQEGAPSEDFTAQYTSSPSGLLDTLNLNIGVSANQDIDFCRVVLSSEEFPQTGVVSGNTCSFSYSGSYDDVLIYSVTVFNLEGESVVLENFAVTFPQEPQEQFMELVFLKNDSGIIQSDRTTIEVISNVEIATCTLIWDQVPEQMVKDSNDPRKCTIEKVDNYGSHSYAVQFEGVNGAQNTSSEIEIRFEEPTTEFTAEYLEAPYGSYNFTRLNISINATHKLNSCVLVYTDQNSNGYFSQGSISDYICNVEANLERGNEYLYEVGITNNRSTQILLPGRYIGVLELVPENNEELSVNVSYVNFEEGEVDKNEIFINVSADLEIDRCRLYWNGERIEMEEEDLYCYVNISDKINETYEYYVRVDAENGARNKTEMKSVTFLVETTEIKDSSTSNFVATYISPTPADKGKITKSQVTISVSANSVIDDCYLIWGDLSQSMPVSDDICSISRSNLQDEINYTFQVVVGKDGETYTLEERTFEVDLPSPPTNNRDDNRDDDEEKEEQIPILEEDEDLEPEFKVLTLDFPDNEHLSEITLEGQFKSEIEESDVIIELLSQGDIDDLPEIEGIKIIKAVRVESPLAQNSNIVYSTIKMLTNSKKEPLKTFKYDSFGWKQKDILSSQTDENGVTEVEVKSEGFGIYAIGYKKESNIGFILTILGIIIAALIGVAAFMYINSRNTKKYTKKNPQINKVDVNKKPSQKKIPLQTDMQIHNFIKDYHKVYPLATLWQHLDKEGISEKKAIEYFKKSYPHFNENQYKFARKYYQDNKVIKKMDDIVMELVRQGVDVEIALLVTKMDKNK